ncbi:hypothetical protein OTU49_016671, partial [Cherax quadricarinatus]
MSGMPGAAPSVILPRPDLTLHHAPPSPHCRDPIPVRHRVSASARYRNRHSTLHHELSLTPAPVYTRSSLKSVPEEHLSAQYRWSAPCQTSFTLPDHQVSCLTEETPRSATMSSKRHSSLRSRTSSSLRSSIRRVGPLYRTASSHVGTAQVSARRWAAALRKRMIGVGGVPLLTPARPRRRPVVVRTRGRPPLKPARNSPRVRAARRTAFAAHMVQWEAASGLAALLECGASAGSALVAGVVRACAAAVAMADDRLQQLRRSISSWSLSTFKKPKISIPKLKTPKFKVFGGRKKNRVDPKDEAAATEEVKAALLKMEDTGEGGELGQETVGVSGEVNQEPPVKEGVMDLPTIILTVDDSSSGTLEYPAPPPSPGLLCATDDIEFIDSDVEETEDCVVEAVLPDVDYSDQWFDARGTLTRSKEDIARIIDDNDEYRISKYYDVSDDTAAPQVNGTESAEVYEDGKERKGSLKAREWVKSFSGDAESRVQRWMKMKNTKDTSSLPKSKSEIRLDGIEEPKEKWSGRDEIQLNATGEDEAYATFLRKEYNANVKLKENERQQSSEKGQVARKENLKKIFKIKGMLSIKPIVDSQQPTYTDTDIHIASAPYALVNTSDNRQPDSDSLDVSEEGIHCTSIDLDPETEENLVSHNIPQDNINTEKLSPNTEEELLPNTKEENNKEIKVTLICEPTSIPNIVIDSPGVTERDVLFPKHQLRKESEHVPVIQSDVSTKQVTTGADDNSILNDVTWAASEDSSRKAETCYQEQEQKKAKTVKDSDAEEPVEGTDPQAIRDESNTKIPEANKTLNTTSLPMLEEKRKTTEAFAELSSTEKDSLLGSAKSESTESTKRKISGATIPKSIKNFAGSLFTQQGSGKAKNDTGEEKEKKKKKKKERISPFNKDYLLKGTIKANPEEVKKDKKSQVNTDEIVGSKIEQHSTPKNTNPFMDDDGNPFADEDTEEPETRHRDDEPSVTITEALPDLQPSTETTGIITPKRESPDSLEYISVIESDDPKNISHESSPGYGTSFVEEEGLRLRQDALLAIKSMNNDDASTHYYSFLSATDDYHTPTREIEQREQTPVQTIFYKESSPADDSREENTQEPIHDAKATELTPAESHLIEKTVPVEEHKPDIKPRESLKKRLRVENKDSVENKDLNSFADDNGSQQETSVIPLSTVSRSSLEAAQKTMSLRQNDPVPTEVPNSQPKFPLSESTQEPPKPSPRNKKGRYGYSTGGTTLTTTTPPVSTTSNNECSATHGTPEILSKNEMNVTTTINNAQISTFPRSSGSCKRVPVVQPVRDSSDSGYVGPGCTYYQGTNSEPIYWEISETKGAPPRPSPRAKKGQRTPSDHSLNHTMAPSPPSLSVTPRNSPVPEPLTIPEWINHRAPIPSPRSKKQRSLQSLPTVVPTDDTMEAVKKKLQMLSHEPLQDSHALRPMPPGAVEGEQFYSGKAASISYGFTQSMRGAPPSPPLRGRKASQVSLPAAMAVEDPLWRQQKRRTVHGGDRPISTSVKRARRRTDPTQGIPAPSVRAAVQRLGEKVVNLTDLLYVMVLSKGASKHETEELLTDVLYSVHFLMGCSGEGVWAVGGPAVTAAAATGSQTAADSSNRTSVSLDQVLHVLQEAFQVNEEAIERLTQEIQRKPAPEVNLHLSVKEANDLRPKTVKGTTNSYVTIAIPNSRESHRTRLERDTLSPRWNQDFILRVNNLQKDVLHLEVMHEHDSVGVKQLTAVRDIRAFGRLVKGTTAQAQHQASHLLGQVQINIKDVSERGLNGWYPLEKKSEGEVAKDRGSLHLVGSVSSTAHLENKTRQSYDSLLARLVHHHVNTATNKEGDEWVSPWNGVLSGSATAALAQYAIMLGFNDETIQLSRWLVGSRVSTVDAAWSLSQLHRVQAALAKSAYQGKDLDDLRLSFSSFVRASAERIKDLHASFPPSSGVLAKHQLTYTIKALHSMQNHSESRALLDEMELPHLHELVTSSLATHTKTWWKTMVEEQLSAKRTSDEQIAGVINIVAESNTFLTHAANFYNSIFLKEMNIPYMQTTYLVVSKRVNPCVRPLVLNIYNRMPPMQEACDNSQYALEVGTSLWQLYRNLSLLHKLGESLPAEVRVDSGVREYHRWFSRGVMRWLELAVCRALDLIRRAVDLDRFEPVDAFCNFSSSATDTIDIFHGVKVWWLKLAWPDPENSALLLAKMLEDICSCGITYSDLLRNKVDSMYCRQDNSSRIFITPQICIGLNNIERVRRELTGLPSHFGFDSLLEDIKNTGSGNGAAAQLESTVERLIFNAAENMETKVNEFIETVIERMRPTLDKAVNEACDVQSAAPFLEEMLDPAMGLLRAHLHSSNFNRFMWRVWETIIEIFHETVKKSTERRRAHYFGGVHSILKATLKFFTPDNGNGLDEKAAETPEYTDLMELLESLRMSTEALISKYYQERYEEQMEDILPCKAQLVAKMLFTRPGKLIVEVIMARDIVVESDTCSISSRGGSHGAYHNQSVDSYIKVQLVPQEWFPTAGERKTRTQRKQDPAVYDETFEYDMNSTDDGVRAGFLLLTLKDYNLGRSNTFLGEALVPLADLPCVDSSEVYTVQNTRLKMTTPGLDI